MTSSQVPQASTPVTPGQPADSLAAGANPAESVLDTLGLACVLVERATGRVAWMSQALETLSGRPRSAVVGAGVDAHLLDPVAAATVQELCVRGMRSSGPVTFPGRLPARGGVVQVTWTASALSEMPYRGTHLMLVAGDQRQDHPGPLVLGHVASNMAAMPVLGTDLSGRVTYCNPPMEAVLGRGAEELLGAAVPIDTFDPGQLARRAAAAGVEPGPQLFLADPRSFDRRGDRPVDLGELDRRAGRSPARPAVDRLACDWTVVRPDGTRVVASVRVRPMADSRGRIVGYLAAAVDVTEERRTHELLLTALDKEREVIRRMALLDETRNDFVATASHELRTPVTSIRGYAELMADGAEELSPRQAMFVEAILRNSDRLSSLADDLLVLCSADAQEEDDLATAALDLREVVSAGAESARVNVRSRPLHLRVDVPPCPVTVLGDTSALDRVVGHLLENAVKFSESGTITCRLRVEEQHAVLEVADTGIGVPAAEQDGLFTRFFRATAAQERAIPGTGLGLSVVHTLVAAHRGEVSLTSEPGHGTTVVVRLPLVTQAALSASA